MEQENVKITPEVREQVVNWINSKERDFNSGLKSFINSNYKPHVANRIKKWGAVKHSQDKLLIELRNYLRYLVNPKNGIHEDEPESNIEEEEDTFKGNIEKELENSEYPPVVKQLLTEFQSLYQSRSVFHKQLKDIGENNDNISVSMRKNALILIDSASYRMDTLWTAFNKYKTSGELPDENLFSEPFNPEKVIENIQPVEYLDKDIELSDDIEILKKMKENFRIKISKIENRLEYQNEKKQETPSPMPEGPKRLELEKKLEWLKKQKERIEYKIVDMK